MHCLISTLRMMYNISTILRTFIYCLMCRLEYHCRKKMLEIVYLFMNVRTHIHMRRHSNETLNNLQAKVLLITRQRQGLIHLHTFGKTIFMR